MTKASPLLANIRLGRK